MSFLQTVFEKHSHQPTSSDPLTALICDEFTDVCRDLDVTKIQESWSWRNAHIGRELAKLLINEKGEVNRRLLFKAIKILEENLFSLGEGREQDGLRQKHLLSILKSLYNNQEFVYAIKRILRPEGHQGAEALIRETLFLSDGIRLTDGHARQAALSALLTNLRQNVGSCFATAPAILILHDQPLQFLTDIGQLLGTGRLTRIYEGIEYSVPLSASWGVGDLFRPFYLSTLGKNPLKILAFSPGFQAAFRAAGLIEKNAPKIERVKKCEKLFKESGFAGDIEDPFLLLTPDQILKSVLLHSFKVSEEDVSTFRARSIQSFMGKLVIQTEVSLGKKGVACSRFLKAYKKAKSAFKSLTDNALLKAWEFSLASLSESKADFAKWNVFASLGVQPEEPNGIGQSLYQIVQQKIERINEEIEEFQSKYDHLFAQAKYLEGRMRRASEKEIGWIRAEYEIRRAEINRALNERDATHDKGRKLTQLYPVLIEFYGKKIREYFQEVYDAEMHDISANPYDDSPAGFRLLYKHGRTNTALWTLIYSPQEYLQHLTSFFVSTEIELQQLPEIEGLQRELSDLITAAITTIKRPEFLESSIHRLARTYREPVIKNPLDHLEKVQRKPWAYVSGGTMKTLVSCYWGNPAEIKEEKRWVESENELLAFFIDTIKELPLSVQQLYTKNPDLSMLAYSPTHAFLMKPGWKLFRRAWESSVYTYTWIRDRWVFPQLRFLDSALLDKRMMEILIHTLLNFIPSSYRAVVKNALKNFSYTMSPPEFRENVLRSLSYEKWLQGGRKLEMIAEELDSILYRALPLFPEHRLREKLKILFQEIDEIDDAMQAKLDQLIERAEEGVGKYKILTARDLRNIACGLLILALGKTRTRVFYYQKITEAMQKSGLAFPEPFLCADTNWVKNLFGFTVNPGTGNLEFWRFDECGSAGRPISIWRDYLNGKKREEWGIYTNPHQYGIFN